MQFEGIPPECFVSERVKPKRLLAFFQHPKGIILYCISALTCLRCCICHGTGKCCNTYE